MKKSHKKIGLLVLSLANLESFCGYEFTSEEFIDMVLHHEDWMNHSMDEMLTHLDTYILKRPVSKFLMERGIHGYEIIEYLKALSALEERSF